MNKQDERSLDEYRLEKMRAYVTKAAINETLDSDAAVRNFAQATNLTNVFEVFRVFVIPKLRRNGHRIQSLLEIDVAAFLERIETAIPLLQSTPLKALK
tara:strand:- start:1306 stop:1602 length:297 start_codon:yes stop_codon:yes gene_type:complete